MKDRYVAFSYSATPNYCPEHEEPTFLGCDDPQPCMTRSATNWTEARRLQAWSLEPQGCAQRRMAEALGISEGAVSQWMSHARDRGPDALRHLRARGAARRLPSEQLSHCPHSSRVALPPMGVREMCGPVGGSPQSFAWSVASRIIRRMSAACARRSAGAYKQPPCAKTPGAPSKGGRRPFSVSGRRGSICRPSPPSSPRARCTSAAKTVPSTLLASSPFSNTCGARWPAAW